MVLIGGVKYACERCIRGHRVTTCNHTDQPLIMIKPKGRPSSQCKHCKNLRVAKNIHSSGACTCGKSSSSGSSGIKKKKCGCESGKGCDCHKKKQPAAKRTNSISSIKSDSSKVVPTSKSPTPTTDLTSKLKRVGEVSVPINEYIPNHSNEIGNVLNEKAVSGFFQDVPLPFEPGHGLLDLFEQTSTHSSSHLTSNHYNTFPITTPTTTANASYVQNNNAVDKNDFDVFQNLVFSPTSSSSTPNTSTNQNTRQPSLFGSGGIRSHTDTTSIPDNVSEHSINSYQSAHTMQSSNTQNNSLLNGSNNYNYNNNHLNSQNNRQSSGLFGSYQNYQNKDLNENRVEVLSLTASFNDIMPDHYEEYNDKTHSSNGIQNKQSISNPSRNLDQSQHNYHHQNHYLDGNVNQITGNTNGNTTSNNELLKGLNLS